MRFEQKLELQTDAARTEQLHDTPPTASELAKNLFLLCKNASGTLCLLPATEASEGHRQGMLVIMRDREGQAVGLPPVVGG